MKELLFLFAMYALTGMLCSCGSDDDETSDKQSIQGLKLVKE